MTLFLRAKAATAFSAS